MHPVNLGLTHDDEPEHHLIRTSRRPHRGHQTGPPRTARPTPGRGHRRRPPGRRGRPPDRALRRPGPAFRRVLVGHRQEHGGHPAGRPEALRGEGVRRPRPQSGVRPVHAARPQRGDGRPQRSHRRPQPRGPPRAPGPRPPRRTGRPRGQGDRRAGRPPGRRTPGGHRRPPPAAAEVPELVPYGPDAKKVLELTFREALRLGHNYIGTEHILLALLEHENGEGVLNGLGIDKPTTEQRIAEMLSGFQG